MAHSSLYAPSILAFSVDFSLNISPQLRPTSTRAPSSVSTLCIRTLFPYCLPPSHPYFPRPCQSINPNLVSARGIRDQVSKAGRLNHSFHSRHSGIVFFFLARPQAQTAQEEEARRRTRKEIALLFCQFLIRTRLSSPNKIICLILSVTISFPPSHCCLCVAVLHLVTTT